MTSPSELAFFLGVGSASAVFVGIVRRIALTQGVIDHPTERGSHVHPTPRGGGLGAVASIVMAFVALTAVTNRATMSFTRSASIIAVLAACIAIAAIGWLDDRRGVPVRVRLVVHLLGGVAVGALAHAGAPPIALRIGLLTWWIFWTVSSINLVNFMDGINGLVALQISIFAASLMLFAWQSSVSTWYAAAVTAACLGFLPWNFPHARIFLGDVGSGTLGYLVPFLALLTMQETGIDIFSAHLPLLPLFADATVTIIRRWRRRESLTQPHRSHLYQRLANGGMGHARVTLLYGGISAAGAVVAHSASGIQRALLIGGYGAGVALCGVALERRLVRKNLT
jgi:UDP-N-acetylmuramyl pentapeptide phosphotransferase/UDP-N-acetylglucosamine-1-phosphate transferase